MAQVEADFRQDMAMKMGQMQYMLSEYRVEITMTIAFVAVVIIVWAIRR
jgi:hypothetical protein